MLISAYNYVIVCYKPFIRCSYTAHQCIGGLNYSININCLNQCSSLFTYINNSTTVRHQLVQDVPTSSVTLAYTGIQFNIFLIIFTAFNGNFLIYHWSFNPIPSTSTQSPLPKDIKCSAVLFVSCFYWAILLFYFTVCICKALCNCGFKFSINKFYLLTNFWFYI